MRLSDFDYALPRGLIAQMPARPRDSARLMLLSRAGGAVEHRVFRDLPASLRAGDALVLNDTRVIPARLRGRRATGGAVEVLLLRPHEAERPRRAAARSRAQVELLAPCLAPPTGSGTRAESAPNAAAPPQESRERVAPEPYARGDEASDPRLWEALVRPGRRVREGTRLVFGGGRLAAVVGGRTTAGTRLVALEHEGPLREVLARIGDMPVPPYIERTLDDPEDYQTVYAERDGAVAAPTAGLHFTPGLLAAVRAGGVEIARLTLHVGLGTFRAVEAEDPAAHRMDAEWYEVTDEAARTINGARGRGGRVVAVGTTCVRTLESVAAEDGAVRAASGWTDLFIVPGFRFRAVDALITNFHLPRTTLLLLVSAFAGRERILAAYETAVRERYRFYSFGDAMLIT